MIIAGIDGCKQGWIMIKFDQEKYSYGIYMHIEELVEENPTIQRILIDMPIGLSSKDYPRTIDKSLRAALIPRQSTVFNPACREAVALADYEAAKKKNIEIEGKSLSIQSFFIQKKIKEIDDFLLQKEPSLELIESHPEFCFKHLNPNKSVLLSKKSTEEGIADRLSILTSYDDRLGVLYQEILAQSLRKNVKKDDILDAMCLCLVNQLAKNQLHFLVDQNPVDERGIAIRIAYHQPKIV